GTVGEERLHASAMRPGVRVPIFFFTNGAPPETYTIAGPRGSGVIGINGAAAHLVHPDDIVILIAYAQVDDAEARELQPSVVFVDADNKIVTLGHDAAEVPADSEIGRASCRERVSVPGEAAAG